MECRDWGWEPSSHRREQPQSSALLLRIKLELPAIPGAEFAIDEGTTVKVLLSC